MTQEEYSIIYKKVLGYFSRRISQPQDAEDLASATVSDYLLYDKPVNNHNALLWTIARNKLYKHIRQKGNQAVTGWDLSVEESAKLATEHDEMDEFRKAVVQFAKKQLKKIDFEVLELSVLCGFDSSRVGKELGLTPSNVRQKLSRSLKSLRSKLPANFQARFK